MLRMSLSPKILTISFAWMTGISVSLIPVSFSANPTAPWAQPGWGSGSGSANNTPIRRLTQGYSAEPDTSPFSPGTHNIAVDVGQVLLMGPYANGNDSSLGARLHYTYGVSELFGFDASFGVSNHSDGKFTLMSILTGLRTNLSWYDKVIPYFVFGFGFFNPTFRNSANTAASLSPVIFGVHVGPGVDLQISRRIFFGASLSFHAVFGSNKLDPSIGTTRDVGGTFASFLVHAGVSL